MNQENSTFAAHAHRLAGSDDVSAKHCFEAIIADADEGVLVLYPSGVIGYSNPAAEFLLGHGHRELVGEMFGSPLKPGEFPTSINVISRDNQLRLVELRIEPLATEPAGTLVLRLRDITTHERHLSEARDEVRRRDEFLAMLSHELRNPLAAIQNAAQLLTFDDLTTSARRDAGSVLERQFKHLTRILDDLLDISRITRGKLVLLQQRVDLVQVLRDAVEAILPTVSKRDHVLEIDIPRHDLWVWGDATRLEQTFVNLLTNAAKFTANAGELKLQAVAQRDKIEVRVQDNGPGIPAELMSTIFEPFVQMEQTLDRSEGGMGIGLMLARTFVELHQGTIEVRANEGSTGVTFIVTLPLLPNDRQEPADHGADKAEEDPLSIALVEDSEDGRRMLALLLKSEGHRVLEAATGSAGLDLILREQPQIAFIDIGLPEMNGYEVARQIQKLCGSDKCRLIAITGYGTESDAQTARDAGFYGHLVKPVEFPRLRELLGKFQQEMHAQRATDESTTQS
ncbi:ATP-binding protein [Anatilimnocola floriformis]|uniref:ATP-binding protein n=1 Tax=Anatilimnocola floriformis TaxID=2948575 RepID=UPI0020C2EFE6|nr:ATP-binding protein [Anatilimnocola floriformis]